MGCGAWLFVNGEDIFEWRFIGKGKLMTGKEILSLMKATWIDLFSFFLLSFLFIYLSICLFVYKWSCVSQAGLEITVQPTMTLT